MNSWSVCFWELMGCLQQVCKKWRGQSDHPLAPLGWSDHPPVWLNQSKHPPARLGWSKHPPAQLRWKYFPAGCASAATERLKAPHLRQVGRLACRLLGDLSAFGVKVWQTQDMNLEPIPSIHPGLCQYLQTGAEMSLIRQNILVVCGLSRLFWVSGC